MANVKISQLPAASAVSASSDVLPLVHSGVTVKATPNQLVQEVLKAPGAIGTSTPANGTFLNLTSTGNFTASGINKAINLSPTGTGSVTISPNGLLTIAPTSLGSMNNVVIGSVTPGPATFNALTLTGSLTASASTGTAGQVLSSTGTGVEWITPSAVTMVYPTAGIAVSNGSAWTTSLTAPTGALVGTTATQILTGKTISGNDNTLSNIDNASLKYSTITFGLDSISLGGTISTFNNVSIGQTTAGAGAFTTLSASSTVSGSGFSTYLASPPAIGGTTPAAGNFTTLGATGNTTLGDASGDTVAIRAGTAALPTLIPNGDPNTGLWFPAADTIAASTAGSERLRIDSSGNVGIGTSSPTQAGLVLLTVGDPNTSARLAIKSNYSTTATYLRIARYGTATTDGTLTISNNWNRDGGTFAADSTNLGITSIEFNSGGYLGFGTAAAGAASPTERLRIDSSGNVGIGTNLPGVKLDVIGTIRFGTASSAYVAHDGANFQTVSTVGNGLFYIPASSFYRWHIDAVQKMTLDASGNLGIGHTAPNSRLGVFNGVADGAGTLANAGLLFGTTGWAQAGIWPVGASAYAGSLVFGTAPSSGSPSFAVTERLRITSAGNYEFKQNTGSGNTSVSFNTTIQNALTLDASGSVGIGTSSLSAKLHVNGGSMWVINSAADPRILIGEGGGANEYGYLLWDRTANTLNLRTNANPITFGSDTADWMRIDSSGNVGIGTSTFGTSAATVLGIKTGTAPTTGPVDTIQIYSTDLSAGNTMLSLFTEGTPVNANTTAAATHRIAIRINGTVYYLLANTAA